MKRYSTSESGDPARISLQSLTDMRCRTVHCYSMQSSVSAGNGIVATSIVRARHCVDVDVSPALAESRLIILTGVR